MSQIGVCVPVLKDLVGLDGSICPIAFAPSLVRLAGNAAEVQVQETMSK